MTLVCPNCHRAIDTGGASWPGDTVVCPGCGQTIEPARAATDIPALSPSLIGTDRPVKLESDQTLPAGTLVGQYRIDAPIGRGGMGAVYRATHTLLSRTVALKVLPPELARDPEFISRFKREAMALAKLQHSNIVAVHDMGVQGEIYFFAMEFVDGVNLRHLLANKNLTPEQALHIVPKLCEALEYAHERGIVHRDIKPENIMIDRAGVPKIADFGLAKILKGDAAQNGLTRTSVVMGTVDYMAPEQRESSRSTDHRADIFSMGVVLYEMLTGQLPVGKFDMPSRKVQIDVRLDEVVVKALEQDPDRRYQRASHLGGDVTQILAGAKVPPAGPIPLVDLRTGEPRGTAARRALSIKGGEVDLRIASWSKDQIALSGDAKVTDDAGVPTIQAGDEAVSIFVPRDMEIAVRMDEGGLSVSDASGRLIVEAKEGEISVESFRGPLNVRVKEGSLTVRDLFSGDFSLHAGTGNVTVEALKLRAGEGTISVHEGDVTVRHDPSAQFDYELTTSNGTVRAPDDRKHHASGRVNGGGGVLRVIVTDGDISLGAPVFDPSRQARDFWVRMPPKYRKEVGNYVITSTALTLFFVLISGTWTVPVMIWIFWGMGLAIKGWNHYTGAADASAAPHGIAVATQAVVATAQQVGRDLAPKPAEPPKPKPRTPAFVVLAMICIVLALLAATGTVILHAFDAKAGPLGIENEVSEMHLAMGVLVFVITGLGVLSLLFSLGAIVSMIEAPAHLRGRGPARFCTATSIILIAYALTGPGRHVGGSPEAVAEAQQACRAQVEPQQFSALLRKSAEGMQMTLEGKRYLDALQAPRRRDERFRLGHETATLTLTLELADDPENSRLPHWSYLDFRFVRQGGAWILDEEAFKAEFKSRFRTYLR